MPFFRMFFGVQYEHLRTNVGKVYYGKDVYSLISSPVYSYQKIKKTNEPACIHGIFKPNYTCLLGD